MEQVRSQKRAGPPAAAEVERWFRSAYFSLFSVPNPEEPDIPLEAELPFPFSLLQQLPFLEGALLRGVIVNEQPLRFQTKTGTASCQLVASNVVGRPIATVHIQWTPIPWDYNANPNVNPPQKILNPLVSQRFEMLDGKFLFDDAAGSGVHGFGSGRTFPNFPYGLSLNIGAVIDVLEGFGAMEGHQGLMVVNGVITPPNDLALNIMQRIIDPSGDLLTDGPLAPIDPQPFPDPGATFMMLLGEPDPERPSRLLYGANGEISGIEMYERLRLVDLDFDVLPREGPRSQVKVGEVVGQAGGTWRFPSGLAPRKASIPIPVQTHGGFLQLGRRRMRFGSVQADLVEGRGFPTVVPGAPTLLYRIGGFGPIQGGSGEFEGASGLVSMNSLVSLSPLTFSNMYIFRFEDAAGELRLAPGGSFSSEG